MGSVGDNRNNEMVAYAVAWRNPFGMPICSGYVFLGWDLSNLMFVNGTGILVMKFF